MKISVCLSSYFKSVGKVSIQYLVLCIFPYRFLIRVHFKRQHKISRHFFILNIAHVLYKSPTSTSNPNVNALTKSSAFWMALASVVSLQVYKMIYKIKIKRCFEYTYF